MPYDDPKVWGRPAWTFLFACIQDINKEKDTSPERVKYCKIFLENLGNILPCMVCKEHYNKYIKDHPIDISDPLTWLIKLYKKINNKHSMTDQQILQWFTPIVYIPKRQPIVLHTRNSNSVRIKLKRT